MMMHNKNNSKIELYILQQQDLLTLVYQTILSNI